MKFPNRALTEDARFFCYMLAQALDYACAGNAYRAGRAMGIAIQLRARSPQIGLDIHEYNLSGFLLEAVRGALALKGWGV